MALVRRSSGSTWSLRAGDNRMSRSRPEIHRMSANSAAGRGCWSMCASKTASFIGTPSRAASHSNHDTLALINDNDFGMTDGAEAFDTEGRLVDSGVETTITYVRVPSGI
jgi:hypothetical protein